MYWLCFARRSTTYEALKNALINAGWMPLLYGGLRMLLCSNNPDFHINVAFTDVSFPNKYSFLTRFEGEFYEPEYCEIFYTLKIKDYGISARVCWTVIFHHNFQGKSLVPERFSRNRPGTSSSTDSFLKHLHHFHQLILFIVFRIIRPLRNRLHFPEYSSLLISHIMRHGIFQF